MPLLTRLARSGLTRCSNLLQNQTRCGAQSTCVKSSGQASMLWSAAQATRILSKPVTPAFSLSIDLFNSNSMSQIFHRSYAICPSQLIGPSQIFHRSYAICPFQLIGPSRIFHRSQEIGLSQPFSLSQRRTVFEDGKSKAVTVWSNLKQIRSSPFPALVFASASLLPFVLPPAYMIVTQLYMPEISFAQVAYGALVISFLGGTRWGFTIPEESIVRPTWLNLSYGASLTLLGWMSLMMTSPFSNLTVMGATAGAAYFDSLAWGYPPWYKGMRLVMSTIAILALWTTIMCSLMLHHDTKPNAPTPPSPTD